MIIIHEASHSFGYRLFGGKTKYGIKWLCPYCQEISGLYMTKRQFIFVLLIPIITISTICILAIIINNSFIYYGAVAIIFNISGASGDILMALKLMKYNSSSIYIKDESYGYSVHVKNE
jgi:hypothetical protein